MHDADALTSSGFSHTPPRRVQLPSVCSSDALASGAQSPAAFSAAPRSPQMRKWLVEGLQKSKLTVTAAKTNDDFSFMDRQRLKLWQENFYAQIETVKEFLLPAEAVQTDR
jgi:hypothetical protein